MVVIYIVLLTDNFEFSKDWYLIFTNPFSLGILTVFIFEIGIKVYKYIRNKYYNIEKIKEIIELKREIDFEYNPSIVGYLFKQEVGLEELSADILNLFAKKIINIEKDNKNKIIVKEGEKYNQEIVQGLSESDKYLTENLIDNLDSFDYEKWSGYIEKEYKDREFCKEPKKIKDKKYIFIVFIVLMISIWIEIITEEVGSGLFVRNYFNSNYICFFIKKRKQ